MADNRPYFTDVSRFWDDLLHDERAMPDRVDPTTENTIRHLQALTASPVPTGARSRARARVLAGSVTATTNVSDAVGPATPLPKIGANGLAPMVWERTVVAPAPRSRGQLGVALATALLLLLISVAVYFAFRPTDNPAVVGPTVEATPSTTPTPEVTSESLLSVSFPAGSLPITDEGFFVFSRHSMFVDESLAYPDTCNTPRLVISLVESGALSARLNGPFDIIRGSASAQPGTRETIAVGAEGRLEPGDVFIYANEQGDLLTGFKSLGPQPLVVLEAAWFPTIACVGGPPTGIDLVWDAYDLTPAIDPLRPFVVSMHRVSAVPGALLTDEGADPLTAIPTADRILQRLYVESGTLEVTGLPRAEGASPVPDDVSLVQGGSVGGGDYVAMNLDDPPDGFRLRNAGTGVLIATVLTIRYAPP